MKKVHPLEINSTSISNISANEHLENSILLLCRFCKKNIEGQEDKHNLVFPCSCRLPIHKSCLPGELGQKGKARRLSGEKEKRYNCSQCAEVIRFTAQEQLRCRSCKEVGEFASQHRCMCATLAVSTLAACGMLILLLVIKSTGFQLQNEVLLQSAVIGFSIGFAVLTLIVLYFFVSEVMLKSAEKVEVIPRASAGKGKKQSITIEDCS